MDAVGHWFVALQRFDRVSTSEGCSHEMGIPFTMPNPLSDQERRGETDRRKRHQRGDRPADREGGVTEDRDIDRAVGPQGPVRRDESGARGAERRFGAGRGRGRRLVQMRPKTSCIIKPP